MPMDVESVGYGNNVDPSMVKPYPDKDILSYAVLLWKAHESSIINLIPAEA